MKVHHGEAIWAEVQNSVLVCSKVSLRNCFLKCTPNCRSIALHLPKCFSMLPIGLPVLCKLCNMVLPFEHEPTYNCPTGDPIQKVPKLIPYNCLVHVAVFGQIGGEGGGNWTKANQTEGHREGGYCWVGMWHGSSPVEC